MIIKGRVVLVLNQAPHPDDVWGSGDTVPNTLASAIYGGKWPLLCLGCFSPKERDPYTLWPWSWWCREGRNPCPWQESQCPLTDPQPSHYLDWSIPAPRTMWYTTGGHTYSCKLVKSCKQIVQNADQLLGTALTCQGCQQNIHIQWDFLY
jgi:hypothetical protein